MISDVHRRLREATEADHLRLEDRVQILARVSAPDARRALVSQFHRMHVEIETAIRPWLAEFPELDFAARQRTPSLERDLIALGCAGEPATRDAVGASDPAEALGLMYVLEGSTLGGRVIRRSIEAQRGDMNGLSFLDPYGDRVGERWKSFLAVLDAAATTPEATDAMIGGARAGFRHAELRLCPEVENV